jgi:hypothetical protein
MLGDQVGQPRRAAQDHRPLHRRGFLQGGHPVQVRVNSDQTLKEFRQKLANDALADGFTGREGDVLAHIGQVRRDQREVLRTQRASGAGAQQQLQQFVVRVVQRSQDGYPWRQLSGQTQLGLAVRKAMAFNAGQRQAAGACKSSGGCQVFFKVQQQFRARHQNSTNTWGRSVAAPMV